MTQIRDLFSRQPKRGVEFPHWLERLVSVGIVSTDPQVVRCQRCVNVAAFATAGNTLSHLLFNSVYDFRGLLAVNIYNVLMIGASLLVPRLHRFGEHAGAITLILLIMFGHTFVVWSLGLASDLQVYYTLAGAMLLFFGVRNWRLFVFFVLLALITLVIVLEYAPVQGLFIPEDTALRDMLSTQALISTLVVNAAILFYALAALQRAEDELQDQHERSEALIGTVMPRPIAERLKSDREARIADRIEQLSVLFADIAGFTGAAHDLAPDQVVEYLDRLVRMFDALAEAHGVEKIKTIGDSYMAAAGFDGRAAEHAVAVGRFALAMIEAVDRHPPLAGRKLKIRIGIHCGAATAGVIGATRFSYDVWGDAVNFASRMESHGVPDRVHVSEAYFGLAGHAFVFEERGTTDLKGLGAARTFFLTGMRSS